MGDPFTIGESEVGGTDAIGFPESGIWTTPFTWVDDVVYDEADFNQQIRDNFNLLKLTRDDAGKILSLSSATLDTLNGLNITGLVPVASANTYLGASKFGASTLVIPVGAGKSSGNGSVWIDGTGFKYINDSGVTKTYVGTLIGASVGLPGSVWVEGNNVHYIDETGAERSMVGNTSGTHSDVAAVGGSVWMEAFMHWVRASGTIEFDGHSDSHSDSGHGDVAHSDVSHSDSHGDVTHIDTHTDVTHSDIAHNDFAHIDHTDVGHADVPHTDIAHADIAHTDSHADTTHSDSHGDTAHSDSHTDDAHGDSHGDQPS
jgi:hypothetical protein